MAKASSKEIVSLKQLRDEITEPQQHFLDFFWQHYLNYGEWPTTFDIHRKYSPEEITNSLRSLGGNVVWENTDSRGNRYELHLIGILLTKDGTLYENWLVSLLEFLRAKYLHGEIDGENFEFDEAEIRKALNLNEEECKLLGEISRFQNDYRSHGHTIGGSWKIRLPPKEIQYIPRTGSLKNYHEQLLFRFFDRSVPVSEKDRQDAYLKQSRSSPSLFQKSKTAYINLPDEHNEKPKKNPSKLGKIFVSHSSQDKELIQALIDLLRSAFRLPAKDILCTSVPGHKLPGGADTEEELLSLLRDARLLIGVLTPASLSSSYVLFEIGARWGLKKPHIPVVANGVMPSDIKEPLKAKNALNAADEDDVHQLIEDVAKNLGKKKEPASAYNVKIRLLVSLASKANR